MPQYPIGSGIGPNESIVTSTGPQGSFPDTGPLNSFAGSTSGQILMGGGSMVISHQGGDGDVTIPSRSGSYHMQSYGSYGFPGAHNNSNQSCGQSKSENGQESGHESRAARCSDSTNVLMLGLSGSFGIPFGTGRSRDADGRESPQPMGLSTNNSYGASYGPSSNGNVDPPSRSGNNSRVPYNGNGTNSPERLNGANDDPYHARYPSSARDSNAHSHRSPYHNIVQDTPYSNREDRDNRGYGVISDTPPKTTSDSEEDENVPLFYVALRKTGRAFANCTFLLPGLRNHVSGDATSLLSSSKSSNRGLMNQMNSPPLDRSPSAHRSMMPNGPVSSATPDNIANGKGGDFERQKVSLI